MSYFIFSKNLDNVEGTLYRIAENQYDLNNLNIFQSDYKIIEDSQENFNAVKLSIKFSIKYTGNTIMYVDKIFNFSKESLQTYIDEFKKQIRQFTDNNPNHPLLSRWNNYYIQLNNLTLDSINYPLTISLEQYFNSLGQPSLNILQLP
jgi:hypothetical protein